MCLWHSWLCQLWGLPWYECAVNISAPGKSNIGPVGAKYFSRHDEILMYSISATYEVTLVTFFLQSSCNHRISFSLLL